MNRNLSLLTDHGYDLCVIGGGIYGVCVAWDAILRGLSVVVLEKGDFGGGTSSNTLRVIHGGIRHLPNGDIIQMRESIHERTVWMRIAPHLVRPLPFVIPTYRNSGKGKMRLSLGLLLYDLIACDRNRLQDPEKHIPRGRIISREECLRLLPGIDGDGLTGAAMYHDAQMYNSERLLLSILKSAAKEGATVANYTEVTDFLRDGARVTGVKARDVLSGDSLEVRAKIVVNAGGPWVSHILDRLNGGRPKTRFPLSKAINLGVDQLFPECAVALQSRGSRLFFITPWRNRSLIGTAHLPYNGAPDKFHLQEEDIHGFIHELNMCSPNIAVRYEDVLFWHAGLVPARKHQGGTGEIELVNRCELLDHRKRDGIDGLISVIGVKFTTARNVAEKVNNLVLRKLGYAPSKSKSGELPVYGGSIDRVDSFLNEAIALRPYGLNAESIRHLVLNHGSAYQDVLKHAEGDPDRAQKITPHSEVLETEVVHAIRDEMAQQLADVVFRRTELGTLGYPGDRGLARCATMMARELRWGHARTDQELQQVKRLFTLRPGNA